MAESRRKELSGRSLKKPISRCAQLLNEASLRALQNEVNSTFLKNSLYLTEDASSCLNVLEGTYSIACIVGR